ncbi:MAG: hypothetical protein MJ238_05845 [Bacilli bacterium]|nr:hypothetical protein [Bacilli bacterium]
MKVLNKIALLGITAATLASCSFLKSLAEVVDTAGLLLAIPEEYELVEVKEEDKSDYQKLMDKARNHEEPNIDNVGAMHFWHLKHKNNLKDLVINDMYTFFVSRDESGEWYKDDNLNTDPKYDGWIYTINTYTLDNCLDAWYCSTNPTYTFVELDTEATKFYTRWNASFIEDAPGDKGICQYEYTFSWNNDGLLNNMSIEWIHDGINDRLEITCSY